MSRYRIAQIPSSRIAVNLLALQNIAVYMYSIEKSQVSVIRFESVKIARDRRRAGAARRCGARGGHQVHALLAITDTCSGHVQEISKHCLNLPHPNHVKSAALRQDESADLLV